MSIKDFEKYRHSLSYTLPTPEEVKKKPYGVVDKGVYGKHFKGLKYYDDEDFNITKGNNIGEFKTITYIPRLDNEVESASVLKFNNINVMPIQYFMLKRLIC